MSNEIVKHHNDLNTVIMRKWTAEEMNFFFAIIAKAKERGCEELVFDKYQLAELADYSIQHNKRFHDTMDSLANNISKLRYIEKTSNSIEYMPLFTRFKVEWKEDLSDMTATISLSPLFEYILNKLEANFTQYELREFTNIRSTYAKTAYRLLKQWRTVGRKEFKIDEFKLLMDTPGYYQISDIDRLVIKPILKEVGNYFEGLKVKKIKSNKRGNPVLGYEFTWKKEVVEPFDPNKYQKDSSVQEVQDVPSVDDATTQQAQNVEIYAKFFEKFGKVAKNTRNAIIRHVDTFNENERLAMLNYAYDIYVQNNAKKPSYITAIVREWSENELKTLSEAVGFYESNYEFEADEFGTSVPTWSEPDYQNTTTDAEKEELERKKQEALKKIGL